MSRIVIKSYQVGVVKTNCYLIYDEKTKAAVMVDPGDWAEMLLQKCRELAVEVQAVLLTHGHFDHMGAAKELCRHFNAPLCAGEQETELLADPGLNLSMTLWGRQLRLIPDRQLKDGDVFELLGVKWKAIATPGHTVGSVCFWIEEEGILISGDTLFLESLGRTDFPTGNQQTIISSITEKLFVLPDQTKVYPGHGEATTIAHEKQYNPASRYNRRR